MFPNKLEDAALYVIACGLAVVVLVAGGLLLTWERIGRTAADRHQ